MNKSIKSKNLGFLDHLVLKYYMFHFLVKDTLNNAFILMASCTQNAMHVKVKELLLNKK